MKCYICDQTPPITGMRYNVTEAIGICHECGIGVCAMHSHKGTQRKSPLLCSQCAGLNNEISAGKLAHHSSGKREGISVLTMPQNA